MVCLMSHGMTLLVTSHGIPTVAPGVVIALMDLFYSRPGIGHMWCSMKWALRSDLDADANFLFLYSKFCNLELPRLRQPIRSIERAGYELPRTFVNLIGTGLSILSLPTKSSLWRKSRLPSLMAVEVVWTTRCTTTLSILSIPRFPSPSAIGEPLSDSQQVRVPVRLTTSPVLEG